MDVLIVDDHPIIHQTLGAAVRAVLPNAQIHDAYKLNQALSFASSLSWNALVLLDLVLPDSSGIEGLQRFRRDFASMRIAVVSASEAGALVTAALKAGAAGYIPKTSTPEMIIAALQVILAGGTYIPKQILPDLAEPPTLTARQLEALQLLVRGLSNHEMAIELGITDNTVKQHIHAIFLALSVTSRSQAIVVAMRLGFDLRGGKF